MKIANSKINLVGLFNSSLGNRLECTVKSAYGVKLHCLPSAPWTWWFYLMELGCFVSAMGNTCYGCWGFPSQCGGCPLRVQVLRNYLAAAAAKSLQSCPTLCDPIDSSPPGTPVPGIFQARVLGCHYFLQRNYLRRAQIIIRGPPSRSCCRNPKGTSSVFLFSFANMGNLEKYTE